MMKRKNKIINRKNTIKNKYLYKCRLLNKHSYLSLICIVQLSYILEICLEANLS